MSSVPPTIPIANAPPADKTTEDGRLDWQHTDKGAAGQATMAPAPLPLVVPAIPGYEIEGVLGRGGMGVVYKARQTALGRTVALKMILADVPADDAELKRFRQEAEAVARLQHPHIVQIYEIGEVDGRPYFTLEYLAGGNLQQHVKGQPQPPREAATMVATIARAVDVCHQRGIIHRDLKPGNVLLQNATTPKIADFGLARRLDSDLTKTGSVLGTPSYMAPEQAAGRAKEVGPPCDIWALGAILYHLLTGRPPFLGATAYETVDLVLHSEPTPPRRLTPTVPPDLETICLKALQKLPSRRYATAAEVADDLERFLRREPIRARPVGIIERTWRWTQRHPAIAGLLAALAIVICLSLTVLSTALVRVSEERDAKGLALQQVQAEQRATANALWHIIFDVTDGMEKLPAARELRMKLLKESLARALLLDPHAELMEGVHHSRVGAHSRLSDIFREVGETAQSRKHVEAALGIARRLAAEKPDEPHYQEEVFVHHAKLGDVLLAQGQLAEPKRLYDLALAYAVVKEGKKPKQQLHQHCHLLRRHASWAIAAEDWAAAGSAATRLLEPASAGPFPPFVVLAHRLRGEAAWRQGDLKAARRELEQAVASARAHRARPDSGEEDRRLFADALSCLGEVALLQNNLALAETSQREALAILLEGAAPLGSDLPRDLLWAAAQERLAAVVLARGDAEGAMKLLGPTGLLRRQWSKDRTNVMRQVELARHLALQAKASNALGTPMAALLTDEARALWQRLQADGMLNERPDLRREAGLAEN